MTLLIDMFPSEGSERALAQRVPAVFGCAEDCVTGNLVQPTVERPIPSQAGWKWTEVIAKREPTVKLADPRNLHHMNRSDQVPDGAADRPWGRARYASIR